VVAVMQIYYMQSNRLKSNWHLTWYYLSRFNSWYQNAVKSNYINNLQLKKTLL